MLGGHKLVHVFIMERDFYARQAIVSYLSWDRRTRVLGHSSSFQGFFKALEEDNEMNALNSLLVDESIFTSTAEIVDKIAYLKGMMPSLKILILAQEGHPDLAWALKEAGANGYLLRDEVNICIASALVHAMEHDFIVTNDVNDMLGSEKTRESTFFELPERRHYPMLTNRIEQALWLCVIEGLPAEVAALEMGISTSTIRSYVKEGYRILEANDLTRYPLNLSPVELAFLRMTAVNSPDDEPPKNPPWQNAA